MQLQVLVEDFLRHIELERGLSPRTVVQYGDELEKWLAYLSQNGIPADTDDVSVDHLRRWVQDMSSAGLAPRTVKKRLSCLRSFYAFACHYHGLPASPAAAVMSPRIPHTLPDVLTRSEVARLLEACEANHFRLYRIRDKCMLLICCTLGLRRQELLDLRLDDWDAEQRTVRIRKGKGDRERLLPCPDELNAVVSQWLEVRPRTDQPYLFVSRQGYRIGPDSLQHMLARASKAAGLDRPHLHMFRHFAATAIVNGHGTEQARRILGHAGYDTLAVYTHLSVEDLRPAVNHTAAMAGISVRAAGDAADPRLDPGTELAGKQLQDLVASMPDDWRQSPSPVYS